MDCHFRAVQTDFNAGWKRNTAMSISDVVEVEVEDAGKDRLRGRVGSVM